MIESVHDSIHEEEAGRETERQSMCLNTRAHLCIRKIYVHKCSRLDLCVRVCMFVHVILHGVPARLTTGALWFQQGEADMLALARAFEWRISEVVAGLTSLVKDMDVEGAKMAVCACARARALIMVAMAHMLMIVKCSAERGEHRPASSSGLVGIKCLRSSFWCMQHTLGTILNTHIKSLYAHSHASHINVYMTNFQQESSPSHATDSRRHLDGRVSNALQKLRTSLVEHHSDLYVSVPSIFKPTCCVPSIFKPTCCVSSIFKPTCCVPSIFKPTCCIRASASVDAFICHYVHA